VETHKVPTSKFSIFLRAQPLATYRTCLSGDGGHTDITLLLWQGHLNPIEKLHHFTWMAIMSQEMNSSLAAAPIHPLTHPITHPRICRHIIHSSLHTYIHPSTHACMNTHIHPYTQTHAYIHTCIPTYIHTHIHTITSHHMSNITLWTLSKIYSGTFFWAQTSNTYHPRF